MNNKNICFVNVLILLAPLNNKHCLFGVYDKNTTIYNNRGRTWSEGEQGRMLLHI